MTAEHNAADDGSWVPQPLPDDDALARQPDLEELARSVVPELVHRVDDAGTVPLDALLPVEAARPEDAASPEESVAATDSMPPAPDAGADASADAGAGADAGADADSDAVTAVPPEVLLSAAAAAPDARHSWTAVFAGAIIIIFFVFAPLQVMAGGVLPWSLAYIVGGTLAISGGVATGREVAARGSARLGPLVVLVVGLAVVLGCAVASVVASQQLT